ncbi:MAG: aspartate aminotransferase family protein [Methylophilaceae bacterium]
MNPLINSNAARILTNERARFLTLHPNSAKLAKGTSQHFLYGVPMHWMNDWGSPTPLFVSHAQGAHFWCADDIDYTDFCLGDTGAMFGHSPHAVAQAITAQANQGFTTMLPSTLAPAVGKALENFFGLAFWQLATTATDANRFVLRWARAVTNRQKLLVFDGCYHGTVDDTMVDVVGDKTENRASLLGQVYDLGLHTVALPFNDLNVVEQALASGEFAALLTEPALTNCGMVLPKAGFIENLRKLCTKYDTLLILDETHTISTAHGGWAKANNITPDFIVVGKPIAGGLPAAAYGFSAAMAARMQTAKDAAPAGHSGIGTTLSGNMMTLAAIHATLTEVATKAAYEHMLALAKHLEDALFNAINAFTLPWQISRMGARLELQFCETAPKNAAQARAAQNETLENAIHLYLLNRGVLLTPFHNMMLICPSTTRADVTKLVTNFTDCLKELTVQD